LRFINALNKDTRNATDYAHTGIKPEVISGSGITDTKLTSISVNK